MTGAAGPPAGGGGGDGGSDGGEEAAREGSDAPADRGEGGGDRGSGSGPPPAGSPNRFLQEDLAGDAGRRGPRGEGGERGDWGAGDRPTDETGETRPGDGTRSPRTTDVSLDARPESRSDRRPDGVDSRREAGHLGPHPGGDGGPLRFNRRAGGEGILPSPADRRAGAETGRFRGARPGHGVDRAERGEESDPADRGREPGRTAPGREADRDREADRTDRGREMDRADRDRDRTRGSASPLWRFEVPVDAADLSADDGSGTALERELSVRLFEAAAERAGHDLDREAAERIYEQGDWDVDPGALRDHVERRLDAGETTALFDVRSLPRDVTDGRWWYEVPIDAVDPALLADGSEQDLAREVSVRLLRAAGEQHGREIDREAAETVYRESNWRTTVEGTTDPEALQARVGELREAGETHLPYFARAHPDAVTGDGDRSPTGNARGEGSGDWRSREAGAGDDPRRVPDDAARNPVERYVRSRVLEPAPDNVIRFPFDSPDPVSGDVARVLSEIPAHTRDDPRAVIRFHVSASRTGSAEYNQRLTEERGETIERHVEEFGVAAQVEVVAHGESLAREADRSLMQLDPPSDAEADASRADRRDDPGARVAIVEVIPYISSAWFEEGETVDVLDAQPIDEAYREGEREWNENVAPLGEAVREMEPSPENPIREDPSSDPFEFLDQFWEEYGGTAKKALKQPVGVSTIAKLLGKELAGTFYEVLVRNQQIKEIPDQRLPGYRAIAEGLASSLDSEYTPYWTPEAGPYRRLFERAHRAGEQMSKRERRQLKIYLVERDRNFEKYSVGEPISAEYVIKHFDGSSYSRGILHCFQQDKHFDRQ